MNSDLCILSSLSFLKASLKSLASVPWASVTSTEWACLTPKCHLPQGSVRLHCSHRWHLQHMRAEMSKSKRVNCSETGYWHHRSIWPIFQDGKPLRSGRPHTNGQLSFPGGLEILRAVTLGLGCPWMLSLMLPMVQACNVFLMARSSFLYREVIHQRTSLSQEACAWDTIPPMTMMRLILIHGLSGNSGELGWETNWKIILIFGSLPPQNKASPAADSQAGITA